MIAFGVCVGSEAKLRRFAMPGLHRAVEPDSPIAEATTDTSIFAAYNEVLDAFGDDPALEALVLLHEDVEILVPDFCARLRRSFREPDIAVVGVVGARAITSLRWWEGEGRGRVQETRGVVDFGGGRHDVDAVDGLLLALSPWAARTLRFDTDRYTGFHGYDVDLCLQARARARRVIVDDLPVFHHTKGGYGDLRAFEAADAALRAKWGERLAAAAAGPIVQAEFVA
jgi:glycosyl transferase family 2